MPPSNRSSWSARIGSERGNPTARKRHTPELTLRVFTQALREEETDLSFLDFGGTRRHPRGTERRAAAATRKPPRATARRGFENLERETGVEPATLSLGS